MSEKKRIGFVDVMSGIGKWAYTLRSILLAIPVTVAAIILAIRNSTALPPVVSFEIPGLNEGQLIFQTISMGRGMAVVIPLVLTIVCLVTMFCSRKVIYPWLISLFTLVLPIVLLIVNTFP